MDKLHVRFIHNPDGWLKGCHFVTVGYKYNYASDDLEHLYKVWKSKFHFNKR